MKDKYSRAWTSIIHAFRVRGFRFVTVNTLFVQTHFGFATTMPNTRSGEAQPTEASSAEQSTEDVASMSDTASSANTKTVGRPTPPVWEEFSREDWHVFRDQFRTYKQLSANINLI